MARPKRGQPAGEARSVAGARSNGRPGPGELVLMASVARRHYLQGRSNVEIAQELGLSRFKVARLLDAALTTGIVRIEITSPAGVDVELSDRVQEAYGLRHCLVVDADDPPREALLPVLGRAAAELLSEIVEPNDVLGLVWARSVSALSAALRRCRRYPSSSSVGRSWVPMLSAGPTPVRSSCVRSRR